VLRFVRQRIEVVGEVLPARSRDEVESVDGDVVDDDRLGTESGRQSEIREEVEPLCVAFRLVVADDGEEGNIGVRERPENFDGSLQVDQRRPTVVKEVAGVDDRVDIVGDRVLATVRKASRKSCRRRSGELLLVPDVGIARMDNPRHWPVVGEPTLKGFRDRSESGIDTSRETEGSTRLAPD